MNLIILKNHRKKIANQPPASYVDYGHVKKIYSIPYRLAILCGIGNF